MTSTSGGQFSLTNWSITSRTESCPTWYLLRSNSTWQWFKTFASVYLSPHNLQWLDEPSLHLHIARFALCGRVSWGASKQIWGLLELAFAWSLTTRWQHSFPSADCSSPWLWFHCFLSSSHRGIPAIMIFLYCKRWLELASLLVLFSFSICSLATCWATGSCKVMSLQTWLTCIFLYGVVRLLVDLGFHSSLDPLSLLTSPLLQVVGRLNITWGHMAPLYRRSFGMHPPSQQLWLEIFFWLLSVFGNLDVRSKEFHSVVSNGTPITSGQGHTSCLMMFGQQGSDILEPLLSYQPTGAMILHH